MAGTVLAAILLWASRLVKLISYRTSSFLIDLVNSLNSSLPSAQIVHA